MARGEQGRTVAVVLDEEGIGPHLLPLLGQVHEAPAERGQRPGESHRGEKLEQVRPEDLGAEPGSVGGAAAGAPTRRRRGSARSWGGGPASAPAPAAAHCRVRRSQGQKVRRGERSLTEGGLHTHVAHPVHGGADQVEGADADVPHTVRGGVLAVGTRLLRLAWGGGGQRQVHAWGHHCSTRLWALGREDTARVRTGQTLSGTCRGQVTHTALKLPKDAGSPG